MRNEEILETNIDSLLHVCSELYNNHQNTELILNALSFCIATGIVNNYIWDDDLKYRMLTKQQQQLTKSFAILVNQLLQEDENAR